MLVDRKLPGKTDAPTPSERTQEGKHSKAWDIARLILGAGVSHTPMLDTNVDDGRPSISLEGERAGRL